MANFDNGLPPASTDMTGKGISDVSIQTENAEIASQQGVQSVHLNTEATDLQTEASIKSIVYSAEPTGKNLVLFYL